MAFTGLRTVNAYSTGNRRKRVFSFTGPTSYSAGGIPFAPRDIGFDQINFIELVGCVTTATGVGVLKEAVYSPGATPPTTAKLLLATGPGVEDSGNLSALTYTCVAEGI
jgi:hypothetical protein